VETEAMSEKKLIPRRPEPKTFEPMKTTPSNHKMQNLLVETYENKGLGLRASVWMTVNGKWLVSFMDTDSGEMIHHTYCASHDQANSKASEFVFGRIGQTAITI